MLQSQVDADGRPDSSVKWITGAVVNPVVGSLVQPVKK